MNISKQVNIFIVDDNKSFSLALKGFIETTFNKILLKINIFETGEKCMERFVQLMPDLVILDYSLNSNSSGVANGLQKTTSTLTVTN